MLLRWNCFFLLLFGFSCAFGPSSQAPTGAIGGKKALSQGKLVEGLDLKVNKWTLPNGLR